MKLLIIRHGEVKNFALDPLGPALSEQGIEDLAKVKEFIELQGVRPGRLFTSPMRRALQTAQILNEVWSLKIEEVPWLRPGVLVPEMEAGLLKESTEPGKAPLVLVSHQPGLGNFIAQLLWKEEGQFFNLSRGSGVFLDLDLENLKAKMLWMISPELLD